MSHKVAAIDFGTNTARLLIADLHGDGSFEHVYVEREIVRMGGGFTREAGLSPEALQRGSACLARFAAIISRYDVSSVRAVATSAVRDAVNGPDFVSRIEADHGILLNVIDGNREARLTLGGVLTGLDRNHESILLFDMGGGSTEYTLVQDNLLQFSSSLALGVVRLTEGKGSVAAMEAKIAKELGRLAAHMARSGHAVPPGTVLIGTAGTATTLAAINMGMVDYDYRRVNNYLLSREAIRSIYERLLPLPLHERLKVPGLEKGREDLIIAGMLITLQTMDLFGMDYMKVSDYGLLEGLVVSADFPSV